MSQARSPKWGSGSASHGEPGQLEASGRSVDEAIERGLASLGVDRAAVDINILDEGSRGVLGIGGREARVRLIVRSGRRETAEAVARGLLGLMGISGAVSVEDGPESVRVNVEGAEIGALIGKHGQTLGAVETLVALLVSRKMGVPVRIELDAEGYRERREASLQDLARRTAAQVARRGREVLLAPMGPRDRRVIHVTLQDHPSVSTVSRGERDMRRVVIMPKGKTQDGADEGRTGNGWDEGPGDESQPGGPSEQGLSRRDRSFGPAPGGPRPGLSGRRSSSDSSSGRQPGRRVSRQGSGGGFGRRPEAQGQRSGKLGRPEGLPVDEELEAEIEAYLSRTGDSKEGPANPHAPAEEEPKKEAPGDVED